MIEDGWLFAPAAAGTSCAGICAPSLGASPEEPASTLLSLVFFADGAFGDECPRGDRRGAFSDGEPFSSGEEPVAEPPSADGIVKTASSSSLLRLCEAPAPVRAAVSVAAGGGGGGIRMNFLMSLWAYVLRSRSDIGTHDWMNFSIVIR